MKRTYPTMDTFDGTPNKVARIVERHDVPQGIELVNSYAATKSSTQDLVELAMAIEKADSNIKINAQNKLRVIAEQMRFLQMQAQEILQEAKQYHSLHHAACNFVKHPGQIYHLYEKASGQIYFSILSPEEWGSTGPRQIFKGSYRLEQDNSWTPMAKIQSKNAQLVDAFEKHLSKNVTLPIDSTDTMSVDS